ncbi:hypothetical protein Ssi03_58950 [Sphaerisporangium siamense]|uniref:Uncharacterized protein n=1 Tax=Sphaerisporangium siamense TaxID=795645 RepID=A0A7W7D4B4_9ACTN|nr:hypothetical protein [Sphaerisporangium siamense]MBB4699724.1 hypothetical protein [Sphaerisporangium siamense]GII87905.1 hypothetical protein Ssi03_58950 [Sphaerisporangium siamense]
MKPGMIGVHRGADAPPPPRWYRRARRNRGRHRVGAPSVPIAPRRWDVAERAAAALLDRMEPGWFVTYGVGSRRFAAIAVWSTPVPLMVQAATIEELRDLMREAELDPARPGLSWAWAA